MFPEICHTSITELNRIINEENMQLIFWLILKIHNKLDQQNHGGR